MKQLFNFQVFLAYLGGVFSLILPVVIIISKKEYKRQLERDRLKPLKEKDPESVGDIEAKLDDSFEYKKESFSKLFTEWGLQPLLIISFVNLLTDSGIIEVTLTFFLTLFIILHEFTWAIRFSSKKAYQTVIFLTWIVSFFAMSYRINNSQKKDPNFISQKLEH